MGIIKSVKGRVVGEYGEYSYGVGNITVKEWGEGQKLVIGNYCSVAMGVLVMLGGNHRTDWVTTYPFGHLGQNYPSNGPVVGHPVSNGDIIIGNDVWLATDSSIISGVTIGDGAVLAAKSHVISDVEPYSIVGGNPAKHIKYRFDAETIDALLKIKWWDWDVDKVIDNIPLLCNTDISAFVEKHLKDVK